MSTSNNSSNHNKVNNPKTMNKKQLRLWFLIPFIVFIGLIVMLYMRLGQPTDIVTNTALERPVPTFELPLLSDTSRIMTNENLPDTPFLMNIWGSWCPTCVIEHPFLMQLEERGVNLVGINYKDEIGDALGYLNRGGDPFSMSIQDLSGQFALDLGLTGAPETFVVDGEGIIRQHIIGEINESNWQDRIAPCLMVLNDANSNNVSPDSKQIGEVCK
ncbi:MULTISPECIES: DsbE family thiol:disulfide interchange protein [Psychrobacter]|uniref:DsbE family thiol:disulfide interchange protein n=1 Tax=Psychrobacter TaxID=497 RepID=UPI00097E82F8|nr:MULTISPECIES: DsbE family thiol:disulfide interchange protein [Psychrobacter]SJN21744.1 Cytochrome c-type biogenesis protein CcmG/DsbE, thiol:disulfide oxidoreductase [Psychrobacter sp. JB385]